MVGEIDDAEIKSFDVLIRSGRAVLFPMYQGTFQRRAASLFARSTIRDVLIQACRDLRRGIDYLQTRPDTSLEAEAVSWGAGRERADDAIVLRIERVRPQFTPETRNCAFGRSAEADPSYAAMAGCRRPFCQDLLDTQH